MNINWFPGHMKKTRELIQKNLKLVDIVYEVIDARIPVSSRNPEIDQLVQSKPRVIIMNKADLASETGNAAWKRYFEKQGYPTLFMEQNKTKSVKKLIQVTEKAMGDKRAKQLEKGIVNRPIRIMIVGIPNAGKSTIINALAKRKSTQTGNRPGVTKGKQWVKLANNLELLDTPGILWPKFEDEEVAKHLAFTGAIRDEIMDTETLALRLIERLILIDPMYLEERYKVEVNVDDGLDTMEIIARKRGCIMKSREIDYTRIAHIILDEFRRAIIGRITLEFPEK